MKKIYYLVKAIAMSSLSLQSCSNLSMPSLNKSQYLESFNSFVAETEKSYITYDSKAWNDVDVRFKALSETEYARFSDELTEEEKLKVDVFVGRYYAVVVKDKSNKFKGDAKRFMNKAKSFLENVTKP